MEFLPPNFDASITTRYRTLDMAPDTYHIRKWITLEKRSEHPVSMLPKDVAAGVGIPYTTGRYLCRLAGTGNENKLAFMRVHKQIPQTGTELQSSTIRRAQAVRGVVPDELVALTELANKRCTATPKLLGWHFAEQDETDNAPGGYLIYIVWEKVRGEPLSEEEFWSFPHDKREIIRQNVKKAYSQVLNHGVELGFPLPRHVLLDRATYDGTISGFRRSEPIEDDFEREWNDTYFVGFHLVLVSRQQDKYLPRLASDLKTTESNGWRW